MVHGDRALELRLGQVEGNILEQDVSKWARVDCVVSGPPRPPWSSISRRASFADARAKVFDRVSEIIITQGYKQRFYCVVEMVTGIDHIDKRTGTTPWETWVNHIMAAAPMWEVTPWFMNTKHWLPHHRPRIYTVFTNKLCMARLCQLPMQRPCA